MDRVTDDLLDELARELGFRLDMLTARYELAAGLLTSDTFLVRVRTLAATYDQSEDDVETLLETSRR